MKFILILLACLSSALAIASEIDEVAIQRSHGCVNSTFGICKVPFFVLFTPYSEELYGKKVVVKGYLKRIGSAWFLFASKESSKYALFEGAIAIYSKDAENLPEFARDKYIQVVGFLKKNNNAEYWSEIELTSIPQEVPQYSDSGAE